MSKMRLTWAAALLVLCVGICAGGALAQTNWTPGADNIPASLGWDQGLNASIATENTGTTNWGTNTSILSVDTPTSAAIAQVNRWGTDSVAIVGPVERTRLPNYFNGTYTWEFGITAPPIASLAYATPVGPTTPPVPVGLACDWALAQDGAPVGGPYTTLPLAGNDVFVFNFPDQIPDDSDTPQNEGLANGYIAELAGRVPMIVQGYNDNTYRPNNPVNRGTMAAYISRALQLPVSVYVPGTFSDPGMDTYPLRNEIQQCVDAGIVQGYADGTYRPTANVNRGNMAIFVARGLAGGDSFVPTPTGTATFPDVPTTFQPWKYVEYAVDAGVVQGYGDGTYRPALTVARGQMAIFIYRAFVQSTPSVVVLAGPGVTDVDTATVNYDGWSSIDSGLPADPGTAYVGFDAVRLGDAQVVNVSFALMDGATEIAASGPLTLDAATVKSAALASGNPYAYVTWDIPSGLGEGTYELVVTVDGTELSRKPVFRIGDPTPAVVPATATWVPTVVSSNGSGVVAGTAASLVSDDANYYSITNGTDGITGFNATGAWPTGVTGTATSTNVKKIHIEMVFNTSLANPADIGFSLMESGSSGGKRYCASPAETTTTDATFTYETACEARIINALWTDQPNYRVLSCGTYCPDPAQDYPGPAYTFNVDMVTAVFTLK